MANSIYYDTTNRILQHAGQATIADTATFDDNTLLEKPQLQAKLFVDKANRRLSRTNRHRLARRKFIISATSSTNSYSLDTSTCLENLVQGSIFIISPTASAGGPLQYISYDEWLAAYPAGETVKGIPRYWFDYPPDGTGDKIGFSPPPNGNFTIQYEGYRDVQVLTSATDTIEFSPRFEDILWEYAHTWLEMSLSEGKAADLYTTLDALMEEIRQLSLGARDNPPRVSTSIMLRGVKKWSNKQRYADSPD